MNVACIFYIVDIPASASAQTEIAPAATVNGWAVIIFDIYPSPYAHTDTHAYVYFSNHDII